MLVGCLALRPCFIARPDPYFPRKMLILGENYHLSGYESLPNLAVNKSQGEVRIFLDQRWSSQNVDC